jgi:hypothetical protein
MDIGFISLETELFPDLFPGFSSTIHLQWPPNRKDFARQVVQATRLDSQT